MTDDHTATKRRRAEQRRQLYQAGELLRDVFYMFRRKMYEWPVEVHKMEFSKDREIASNTNLAMIWVDREGEDTVWKYPDFAGLTDDDHAAILTYNACCLPHRFFEVLIENALDGTFESIQELTVDIYKHHKRVNDEALPGHVNKSAVHDVYLVTLEDRSQHVLDIAGAQFGQMSPVIPLGQYEEDYLEHEEPKKPFGTFKETLKNADIVFKVQGLIADRITEKLGGKVLRDLAQLDSRQLFDERKKAEIHQDLGQAIDEWIEELGGYGSLHCRFEAEAEEEMERELKRVGLI